jgi:hypothetical protein
MPLTEKQKAAARARYAQRCKDPAFIERMRLQARERYYRRRAREEADGVARKPVGRPRKYAPFLDPVPYLAKETTTNAPTEESHGKSI